MPRPSGLLRGADLTSAVGGSGTGGEVEERWQHAQEGATKGPSA